MLGYEYTLHIFGQGIITKENILYDSMYMKCSHMAVSIEAVCCTGEDKEQDDS